MDLGLRELIGCGAVTATVGFLGRWAWERLWKKKDGAQDAAKKKDTEREKRVLDLGDAVDAVIHRQDVAEVREAERSKALGALESNLNRLDGKVDGLQKHWAARFDKLADEFKELENKVEYKLDNLRLELRGDQQKLEERLGSMLESHRHSVHNRLNEATAAQASALNDLFDRLVEKVAEPRPSPANPPHPAKGTTQP